MKRISFILVCLAIVGLGSCDNEDGIGELLEIHQDYTLPQEGASQAANNKILELHDKYNSYVLYKYDIKDLVWTQAWTGGTTFDPPKYVAKEGNPQYVESMLELLDKAWLSLFSDEFLKKGGLPYRVFLCDEFYQDRGWRDPVEQTMPWHIPYDYIIFGKAFVIAGLNEAFLSQTSAQKTTWKNKFITFLWNYYVGQGFIGVPEGFYDFSDYVNRPNMPVTGATANPEYIEEFRQRGFIPNTLTINAVWGRYAEWLSNDYAWNTNGRSNDYNSYMLWLLQAPDEKLESFLTDPAYELIQKKWNFLIDFYKDNYGLDVRKIANAVL